MKRIISFLIHYLILVSSTILLIVILVNFFPYTGLGRVLAIPAIIIFNSIIILASIAIPKKGLLRAISRVVITILITIGITIYFYPQEFNSSVMSQTRDAIRAIYDFDRISKDDLNANGNIHNPVYVVALFKYRDEIPLDGTYQLYEHEDTYFYDYSINSLEEIGSKLIGYHKAIWWYLITFKKYYLEIR